MTQKSWYANDKLEWKQIVSDMKNDKLKQVETFSIKITFAHSRGTWVTVIVISRIQPKPNAKLLFMYAYNTISADAVTMKTYFYL